MYMHSCGRMPHASTVLSTCTCNADLVSRDITCLRLGRTQLSHMIRRTTRSLSVKPERSNNKRLAEEPSNGSQMYGSIIFPSHTISSRLESRGRWNLSTSKPAAPRQLQPRVNCTALASTRERAHNQCARGTNQPCTFRSSEPSQSGTVYCQHF